MFFQSQQVDQLFHFFFRRDLRSVAETICNILINIQIREQRVILKYYIEAALFHRYIRQILSIKNDASAVRINNPQDQIQKRSLAASRRSQNRDNLAVLYIKGNVLENDCSVIALL